VLFSVILDYETIMQQRKIIHIDMDAFYASVEELDFPELKGKPLAVGGSKERGVVAAASYEARKYGVKSAMSSKIAAQMCPDLIFVPPRFDRYKEISTQIHQIFRRFTDIIEPLALDEAFLDVTFNKQNMPSATIIAQQIKTAIKNELNLIASAGVSYNKFLAKMASDQDKPDGLYVIKPEDAEAFLEQLPIGRFFGVGKVRVEKFLKLGVTTGKQLKELPRGFLINEFGKSGAYFYEVCRGIDNRPIQVERERKSLAYEKTFEQDITQLPKFQQETVAILQGLWNRYERFEKIAKTVQLKIKFNDFRSITRSITSIHGYTQIEDIKQAVDELTTAVFPLEKPVRLIGIQLSNFVDEIAPQGLQLTLDL
jgi:DNA polymerase IV